MAQLSWREPGEASSFQGTSEARDKMRRSISHEMEDESLSDGVDDAAEEHNNPPRWCSSGVETYAIQCNACFKWRLIPSKETYEAIGEHILQNPFTCVSAREWRDNVSCADPADLNEDEPSVLWAIDKHNIPRPPHGFYRKVVLRAENAKKFADVYYKTPCGKTLRSMVEVQKYIDEHPLLAVNRAQFSFTSPKGKAEAWEAGVYSKRVLKNETKLNAEYRKRLKESTGGKSPGQALRPQPHNNKGQHVKSKVLSASKLNAIDKDKPRLEKLHISKGASHSMAST